MVTGFSHIFFLLNCTHQLSHVILVKSVGIHKFISNFTIFLYFFFCLNTHKIFSSASSSCSTKILQDDLAIRIAHFTRLLLIRTYKFMKDITCHLKIVARNTQCRYNALLRVALLHEPIYVF